jgi:hypothetical protein
MIMDASVSSKEILDFAKERVEEIGSQERAITEAKRRLDNYQTDFEKELREKLSGKVALVTGTTESVERLLQDGYEYWPALDQLVDAKVIIIGVEVAEEQWFGKKTPKVWAEYYEAHTRNQRGGGLAFRLLGLTRFELVDES